MRERWEAQRCQEEVDEGEQGPDAAEEEKVGLGRGGPVVCIVPLVNDWRRLAFWEEQMCDVLTIRGQAELDDSEDGLRDAKGQRKDLRIQHVEGLKWSIDDGSRRTVMSF